MNSNNQHSPTKEQRDSHQLQTLYVVGNLLKQVEANSVDITAVLPLVLQAAVHEVNASDGNGSIVVINSDKNLEYGWMSNPDTAGPANSPEFLQQTILKGLAGWVIEHQQPALIADTATDPRWLADPWQTPNDRWSIICAPLIAHHQAIGAITIHRPGINLFDEQDIAVLVAIASQAANSIENARLFKASQRQIKVYALLNEAGRIINSSLDLNEIMQALLTQMNDLLHAEALSIALVDKRTDELVYQVSTGVGSDKIVGLRLPANQGISGWVMTHGEPLLVHDPSQDTRFYKHGDKRTGYETRAMICAPICFKGDVLGTVQAINTSQGKFTPQDLELLVNLGNMAGSAVAHAQQFGRLQEAEKRYANLFDDSINPIILTDMRRKIVDMNKGACDFFGYERRELLNRSIKKLHADSEVLPKSGKIRREGVIQFRHLARTKQDVTIPVEVYAKRTLFGETELLQWMHRDISKLVELEQMRQDLTAMLVHDLQSPLSNVISSLDLMRQDAVASGNSDWLLMVDIAQRSSHRLHVLIGSLLDIGRLEAGQPIKGVAPVNLAYMLHEIAEIERPSLEWHKISLSVELDENVPDILVEKEMIQRVFINLIDNAIRHTSGQSKAIVISAQHLPAEKRVLMSVRDNGPGVPAIYRLMIFEKFSRIHERATKGMGLGLAFCRLAVEAHNGRIWVEDAPDGGAAFKFTLPIAHPPL